MRNSPVDTNVRAERGAVPGTGTEIPQQPFPGGGHGGAAYGRDRGRADIRTAACGEPQVNTPEGSCNPGEPTQEQRKSVRRKERQKGAAMD